MAHHVNKYDLGHTCLDQQTIKREIIAIAKLSALHANVKNTQVKIFYF